MRLEKGETINERYQLVRAIGEGGMGAVWAALDLQANELVALKVLREEARVPEIIRRFLREARAAMAVRHPNVVRMREVVMVGESPETAEPIIVMDFLEGESLRARLESLPGHRMPLDVFARMYVAVLSAIGTAHAAGVVHRDLKPDNIFMMRVPGAADEPRVVDFGIAKLTAVEGDAKQSGHLTTTGAVLGTPYYMSPEQVFGDKNIDHRTDVWSLGTIAYECLAGRRPVEGDNIGQILKVITMNAIPPLHEVAPALPADVHELVTRMLSYDRAKRPYDLREVLNVFQRHTTARVPDFGEVTLPPDYQHYRAADTSPFDKTAAVPPGVITPPAGSARGGPTTTAGTSMPAAHAMSAPHSSRASSSSSRVVAMVGGGVVVVALAVGGIGFGIRAKKNRDAERAAAAAAVVVVAPLPESSLSLSSSASSSASSSSSSSVSVTTPPPSASSVASVVSAKPVGKKLTTTTTASVTTTTTTASVTTTTTAAPAKSGAPVITNNPYQ